MTKEVKTGLIIGGLLLLGSATFAAVRYKRQKGRNLLDDLLKNLPKKKSSVVADDPIKQSEAEFNEDRGIGYGDDGRPDWMPNK